MKFLWATGTTIAVLLGWLAFMMADNQPPYEYDVANSYVVPSPAFEGQQITVWWRISKVNRYCPGVGHRILFDPKTRVVLADYDPSPTAEPGSVKEGYLPKTFLLPAKFSPPPEVGYRQTGCYGCNVYQQFVRPLCVNTPDLIFRVSTD